jgi:iron complex outermembrane recepter protein
LKIQSLAIWLMAIGSTAVADHHKNTNHHVEEIVVSAPFQKTSAESAMPVGVLSGEDLRKAVANNLGDTLNTQLGVHSASFGPGVGHAVIRGQSGNRVQVMQNSVNTTDASAISPDHADGIEPLLAKRIEVVRGPSTLLYGNGAVGGIVNVVDDRVPEELHDGPELIAEQSYDSVSHENKTVFRLEASARSISLYAAGTYRYNNDVKVHGLAIDEAALFPRSEFPRSEFPVGDQGEEVDNTDGFIANSDGLSKSGTVGLSWIGGRGFIGLSVSHQDSGYGLPPGAHEHEEEHEEGEADEIHDEEFDEFVRIELGQRRYDLTGEYRFEEGFLDSVRGTVSYTDYDHREVEFSDTVNPGTVFENDGIESRIVFRQVPRGIWDGVLGLQLTDTKFSALGDEAFIPETDKEAIALFTVQRFELDRWIWELGARVERNRLDLGGGCDSSETTTSLGVSLLYDISSEDNLSFSVSRSERAPTIEERYSNVSVTNCSVPAIDEMLVFHAATALVEIGNPDLVKETSFNLELGYSKYVGDWTAELNLYYNRVDDYILLASTEIEINERPVNLYRSTDSTFYGVEAQLSWFIALPKGNELILRLQGDLVRAEFDDGGNLPRMPPARVSAGIAYDEHNWSVDLSLMRVFDQSRIAPRERETDGYTSLGLYGDYHLEVGDSEFLFFIKGSNLLDEEIRNHTSFLKNFAPGAGRSIRFGVRFTY